MGIPIDVEGADGRHRKADEETRETVQQCLKNKIYDFEYFEDEFNCPIHGKTLSVICRGEDPDNMSYEVRNCCERHIHDINEKKK